MIEKVRQIVKQETDEEDWKYHIIPVVNYAKKLAESFEVDIEIVELAALLHDIGRKFGATNHDITGVPEAERILKEFNYPTDVIIEVKHCIESHRGSKDASPKTIIAKIIANADAMAHFDILPVFFYWRCKEANFEDAFKWVKEKIERDWNKKLTLPEAKKIMENKYEAIKTVLDSTGKYI